MNEVHTLLDRKNTICSRKLVNTSFSLIFFQGRQRYQWLSGRLSVKCLTELNSVFFIFMALYLIPSLWIHAQSAWCVHSKQIRYFYRSRSNVFKQFSWPWKNEWSFKNKYQREQTQYSLSHDRKPIHMTQCIYLCDIIFFYLRLSSTFSRQTLIIIWIMCQFINTSLFTIYQLIYLFYIQEEIALKARTNSWKQCWQITCH